MLHWFITPVPDEMLTKAFKTSKIKRKINQGQMQKEKRGKTPCGINVAYMYIFRFVYYQV